MENNCEILLVNEIGIISTDFHTLKKIDDNIYAKVETPYFVNSTLLECEEKYNLIFYYVYDELNYIAKKLYMNKIYNLLEIGNNNYSIKEHLKSNNSVKTKKQS